MIQPSQINHLREAASDIRRELTKSLGTLRGIEPTMENAFDLGSIDGGMMIIERALTRIEMCLKEVK